MNKKKVLISLGSIILIGAGLVGFWCYNAKDDVLLRVKSATERAEQRCMNEAFGNNDFNMYGNDLKTRDAVYHQCLRKEITDRINKFADKEDVKKLTEGLDKIQEGVLSFYWDLYNRQDYGSIGRGVNDAVLGRYYEHILEDVIHFEYVFEGRGDK